MVGNPSKAQNCYARTRFRWESKTGELTSKERAIARATRFGYYGDKKCYFTGKPVVPQILHEAYDLHHLIRRGKPGCNEIANLRLALHGPNANAGKASGIRKVEREKIHEQMLTDATEKLHAVVDYQSGSPEMQANDIGIPKWLDLMCKEILEKGTISRWASLNSGASASGLTYQPILRAYNKFVFQQRKMGSFVDPNMPFEERRTRDGGRFVFLREGWRIATVGRLLRPLPAVESSSSTKTSSYFATDAPNGNSQGDAVSEI